MIITLTLIVGASIGVGSAVVGGVLGYFVGNRTRNERELDEDYQRMIDYYIQPPPPTQPQYETDPRSVFIRL